MMLINGANNRSFILDNFYKYNYDLLYTHSTLLCVKVYNSLFPVALSIS